MRDARVMLCHNVGMTDTTNDITDGMVSIADAETDLTEILATPEPELERSSADMFITFPNGAFVRLTARTDRMTAEVVFGDEAGNRIRTEAGLLDLNSLDSALDLVRKHVIAARSNTRGLGDL